VQRSLFVIQDALAQNDGAIRTSLVALYKALAGGWELQN
jgi:outer membrane protein TolC